MSPHVEARVLSEKRSFTEKLCDLDFIQSIIREVEDIDLLIDELRERAENLTDDEYIDKRFDGDSSDRCGELKVLKKCPMEPALRRIINANEVETGEREIPVFYDKILRRYYERFPEEAAALHPLCILCQSMRDIRGFERGYLTTQVVCKSTLTGDVAYSELGLRVAKLTVEEASQTLNGKACLFHQRKI